jgi:glutamate--cysteine ligase catalytic subunit
VPEYEDVAEQMSVQQILMGKGTYFPGLVPMIFAYLDATGCDTDTRKKIEDYMRFVVKRATGQVCTTATWMRSFVRKHPDYEHDSVVTQTIAYDLMKECEAIGKGEKAVPELLGDHKVKPLNMKQPYPNLLSGDKFTMSERDRLIKKYAGRCGFMDTASPALGPTSDASAKSLPSLHLIHPK